MAFNTKLKLDNGHAIQQDTCALTLSGDTAIAAVGTLKYATDQSSSFVARSMVDAAFVTGKTTCLQNEIDALSASTSNSITGATNGLTKTGRNVKLGGTLTGATSIIGAQTLCFGTQASKLANLCGNVSGCASFKADSNVELSATTAILIAKLGKNIQIDSTDITIVDTQCSKGAIYGGDYSANFVARSIPDVAYVTGQTSTSGVQTVNNGLTKYGTNAVLGGALTGNTTLTVVDGSSLTVTDSRTTPIGVLYGGDYSANYCARSLVDAGYVTGRTNCAVEIAPKAITGVTNGLTKTDCHNARLGGCLTQFTELDLCGANYFSVRSDSYSNCFLMGSGSTSLRANDLTLACSGTIYVDCAGIQIGAQNSTGVKNAFMSACHSVPQFSIATINATCNDGINVTPNNIMIFGCNATFPGAQYCADYSANFTARSLVDKAFVTGCTSSICGNFVCSANNGLTKQGTNVKLGGTLTGNTSIIGAYELDINTNKLNISGATGGVNLGGSSVALKNLVGGSSIICINTSTGVLGTTSVSALGGLTGATNGLHTLGQNAHLGGELIECTHIGGAYCFDIDAVQGFSVRTSGNTDMNIDAQQCGGFLLKSQAGSIDTFPDFTNAIGFLGHVTEPAGFAIYDNRSGSTATGIVYAANYSTNYVNRSLVDKQYVDSIATGLNVHAAVRLATTSGITLSGNQLIDGVLTVNGDRILVKNQGTGTTGSTANGIYIASASTWVRASDYDGTPSGEVSNGDLIPVTSGNTQNNSLWAQTQLNPITVGVTPLIFSLFANTIDVQAGQGIAISMFGGVHTVCVDLASNCGLTFCGNGLAVNPLIAGIGLTYTTGVLDVNVAAGGAVSSIPVKYNAGDCLVINCADITGAVGAITGATNGLTKQAQQVKLGGTITGATTLTLSSAGGALCFTDSRVGSAAVGLQYTGNYDANFTARSLVDAAYVTGKTTTSGIQTANNGLTKVGTNVVLGGALTGSTSICGGSANDLNLGIIGNLIKCLNVDASCNIEISFGVGKCLTIDTPTTPYLVINENGADDVCLRNLAGSCIEMNCTCVNLHGAGGAMSVSDVASKGLVYAGSYEANFTDLSLVDKFFVNNAITGSTLVFNNGLHKLGNTISLGGDLTGNTTIDVKCHTFCVVGAPATPFLAIDDTTQASACLLLGAKGRTCICAGAGIVGGGIILESLNDYCNTFNCTGIVKDNSGCGFGLQYFADYSTTFCDNSLITKSFVTGCIAASGTTVSNGLTKTGNDIKLGGALCQHTSFSGLSAYDLCLGTTASPLVVLFGEATSNVCLIAGNQASLVGTFTAVLSGGGKSIQLDAFDMTVTDGICSKGLVYAGSYEGNFVPLSLVTKQYVDGEVTGGTAIACANNGLTKVGNTVVLGGTLTGATTIYTTAINNFTVYDSAARGFRVNAGFSAVMGNVNSTDAYIWTDGTSQVAAHACDVSLCLDGTGLKTATLKTPTASVEIDGVGEYVAISGCTRLLTTPDAGTCADSVIVWNSVDKQLKTVAGSSLGDKNNIYANTCIATTTTLTTGSSYVQLVAATGAMSVCLPATPNEGQAFKIKDASGNALIFNITVCGNGNNIDGSPTALINTDYGALELMYSSDPAGWYSLAFIN